MSHCAKTAGLIFLAVFSGVVCAQNLNVTGVNLLREAVATNLDGTGVRVAQIEATVSTNGDYFEVNPSAVGVAGIGFAYVSDLGAATNFPNSVGYESGHADAVAGIFYGPAGVATNVAHVDNWFADEFVKISELPTPLLTNYTVTLPSTNLNDAVINQSFIYGDASVALQQKSDSSYDNYAAQYQTLFVSGAGNGGPVQAPSTCYNGLSVGVSDGSSSVGPTADNGRCKPDLVAPGGATSFSTPLVAGAAAVLIQAARRGDGGADTNAAADPRTVKALLLNGAVKPAGWTNLPPAPLDFRYGAGVLNVFNSYQQLLGQQQASEISTMTASPGGPHPPPDVTNSIAAWSAWDFNTNTSSLTADGVNHYFFNLTNAAGAPFVAAATLVWNRHANQTAINNLNLFLYRCADGNLMAASTSAVDNVEHIFLPRLAPGRYDLQVWKAGGSGMVSAAEPYALAWEFSSPTLAISRSGAGVNLSWPAFPAGFVPEAAPDLTAPDWRTNGLPPPVFMNGQNVVFVGATNAARFFRLRTQ
jgi:hypothetical protein